jgi:superoxide reductase
MPTTATQRGQIYKCDICGNIVEVLNPGTEALVCCGEEMKFQDPHSEDKGSEKHVPVYEQHGDALKVTVGSVPHPMEEEHFIQWIELVTDDGISRTYLKPGMKPEVVFQQIPEGATIREFCNVHGHWETSFKH